jgi:hypothetical protein
LYFILAVIFWSAGRLGRLFFVAVSIGMLLLLLSSIIKYILTLAAAANSKGALPWGLLFAKGFFGLSMPLLLMRVTGDLMMRVMPRSHAGVVCDLLDVLRGAFWSINFPMLTTVAFFASLLFITWLLIEGLRRR